MATLSPELLAQLREKLLVYRKRLLDLSLRNKLLNWKASKRFTLNLSGFDLVDAFAAVLGNDGKPVDVVPQYDKEAYQQRRRAIPDRSGFISDLTEEGLAAKALLARRETDALERDSGINHLHLVLGFLEWYDDHGPARALRAPILLVPVKLEKSRINTVTGLPEYTVQYDQTEVLVNPCLVEKLKDLNLKMPALPVGEDGVPETASVATFLEELEDVSGNRLNWRIVPEIKITFLSFAKLRMWRDLDPSEWPEESGLQDKHLIQALFGYAAANEGSDGVVTGQNIEEDQRADTLPLVVSADSSQHAAIADACRGLNMVVQGPPGTGKSQSITNIIATLMHEGKSVLFVAEKFAALDVVKRNLEKVGLGAFVMELHGTKASKPAVYADLRSRLEQTFSHPARLTSVRHDWVEKRKILNRYVTAASKRIGPASETYYEIVGKVERLRAKGINPRNELVGNGAPCNQFSDRDQFFSEVQQLLIERRLPITHSWSDLDACDMEAGQEDNLVQPLGQVIDLLKYLLQAESYVNQALKTDVRLRLEDIIGLKADKLSPFAISDSVMWNAKNKLAAKTNRALVATCEKEASDIQIAQDNLSKRLPDSLRKQVPASASRDAESVSEYGVHATPISKIPVDAYQQLALAVNRLHPLLESADRLGLGPTPNLADVAKLQNKLTVLCQAEGLIPSDLEPGLFQPGLAAILARAKTSAEQFSARRQAVSTTFSVVGDLPPSADLHRVRDDLKAYGGSFFGRMFSSKYKAAKQETLRWTAVPKAYKYPDIIPQLEMLEGLSKEEADFSSDPTNRKLGSQFKGVQTDWVRLGSVVSWTESARSSDLGYETAKALIDVGALKQISTLNGQLQTVWSQIEPLGARVGASGTISSEALMTLPWPEVDRNLTQWHAWLISQISPLQTIGLPAEMSLKDLVLSLQEWEAIDGRKSALSSHPKLRACLGDEAAGVDTNWQKAHATEDWVDAMQKVGMPKAWFQALLEVESQAVWAEIVEVIAQSAGVWEQIHATFRSFEPHLKEATDWIKRHLTAELSQKVSSLIAEGSMLPTWAQYCRLRRRGDELGVRPYLDEWQSGKVPADQLTDMFRLIEYRRLASQETKENSALRAFTIEAHEQARAKFSQLDEELTKLSQQEIAATIADRDIPEGNHRGPRGEWTEGALIKHQVSLQRRQAPLRELTARAHGALQALKPCMMMSPLTVAQFLSPHLPPFDVVVMDEASQILPEDALGAIARGKQLICVGDPKQLPPTGFFKISSDDDDDANEDNETLVEGAESILEVCEAAFGRMRRLRWHYRSLHESLIAFSNVEFYDNELLVFPSPVRDASKYGVRFHKVDGLYQNNRNEIEGRAVIEAVTAQLQAEPTKSIGVITFNLKQKELLEDLLAAESQKDPLLAELLETADTGQEPLIIRNLESIQGEQRDIIFISVNYGPETPGGKMAQRFGPVNSRNGWRRLNVMFSRAKERMEVFSSVYADSIVAEPGATTGAAYLSRFLRYAQTGILQRPEGSDNRPPDSDFEISVADFIRAQGFEVHYQVGVAGFFIDLGVLAPGRTNRYSLGVECDGASYHSSRVARDRDKIREDILRGRGWNIHRVWSTDWFQDRNAAMKRLSAALQAAAR